MATTTNSIEDQLSEDISEFYDDPLGYVYYAFPWGDPNGPLANDDGPDAWQTEVLREIGRDVAERGFDGIDPVTPIREAVASGHGIGKSTLIAFIASWLLDTRPYSRGTVTANTFVQLETKTWATICHWKKMSITSHWWQIGSDKIYHKHFKESWFLSAQTCKEENSEAFAGQHSKGSTSYYLFDEASNIPDKIWEVATGGLKTGESHIYVFGNPTRRDGMFFNVCWGKESSRWHVRSIDSRSAKYTNKKEIAEDIESYGIDSDIVRVRILGLPPSASDTQFIDTQRVLDAQRRRVDVLSHEPLIAGFDVSGGGSAWNVIRFRRGLDARSIKAIHIPGEKGRDRNVLVGIAAQALRGVYNGQQVTAMFVDSAFGAAVVERLKVLGFDNVHEANFGGASPDFHQANLRAYMWNETKDWLLKGAIDSDAKLELGLSSPGYHTNRAGKLVLESKEEMLKRNVASPDDADALALTFAMPVALLPSEPIIEQVQHSPAYRSIGWMR